MNLMDIINSSNALHASLVFSKISIIFDLMKLCQGLHGNNSICWFACWLEFESKYCCRPQGKQSIQSNNVNGIQFGLIWFSRIRSIWGPSLRFVLCAHSHYRLQIFSSSYSPFVHFMRSINVDNWLWIVCKAISFLAEKSICICLGSIT
jgi:hypothetical protein